MELLAPSPLRSMSISPILLETVLMVTGLDAPSCTLIEMSKYFDSELAVPTLKKPQEKGKSKGMRALQGDSLRKGWSIILRIELASPLHRLTLM